MSKKISIYDVAKKAGVSAASVSYAQNRKKKVSAKTKKRIFEAMQELGYSPNHAAISLSTGKSHLIGLCLPLNDAGSFADNPFYSEFIGAFDAVASKKGYDVVLGGIKSEREFAMWLASRRFDALVFFGLCPPELTKTLRKERIPTVLVDVYHASAPQCSSVRLDDALGAFKATEYLLTHGHRQIGFLGGIKTSLLNQQRFDGYLRAMKEYGVPLAPEWVFETETTFKGGYEMAAAIAACLPAMSALVCDADIIAIGLIRHLKELGYAIPADLSVFGFDDIQAGTFIYPPLTTVHQDIGEKGRVSAELLLSALERADFLPRTLVLEPRLVLRGSVRSLKK